MNKRLIQIKHQRVTFYEAFLPQIRRKNHRQHINLILLLRHLHNPSFFVVCTLTHLPLPQILHLTTPPVLIYLCREGLQTGVERLAAG